MSRALGMLLVVGASALSCTGSREPPQSSSRLAPGSVAQVGHERIAGATVERIARAQSLAPAGALDLAVSDALYAQAARTAAPAGVVATVERAATARALLDELSDEARRAGPATDQEIAALLRERWVELARPDAVRTTHAVVLNRDPTREPEARLVAEAIAKAVESASTTDEFMALTRTVPTRGFEVRTERLPPVCADGRSFDERAGTLVAGGTFDRAFASAANALAKPGQLSPVVESSFGFHVIRLEERVPGTRLPPAQLHAQLEPEALRRRASSSRKELVARLRQSQPIELDRAVDELTARTQTEP